MPESRLFLCMTSHNFVQSHIESILTARDRFCFSWLICASKFVLVLYSYFVDQFLMGFVWYSCIIFILFGILGLANIWSYLRYVLTSGGFIIVVTYFWHITIETTWFSGGSEAPEVSYFICRKYSAKTTKSIILLLDHFK